jgi:acetyltransferase-like isoleucine patch superfamily enzyme
MEAKNTIIYPGVHLGENVKLGHNVIIGESPRGKAPGELETFIGDNAVIRANTIIYAGNRIGKNFQSGHHTLIRENNTIGNNVSVGSSTVIEFQTVIEDNVRIHSQAFIPEFCTLREGAWIGPNVVFTNALHPLCPKVKDCIKGAIVERDAKIGANATIMPDLVIGEKALVGAGSVVVKDVAPGAVVAGNPAKKVKSYLDLTCPYNLIERPYEP